MNLLDFDSTNTHKNLLYLASGIEIKEEYFNLPFNVYLVDKLFKEDGVCKNVHYFKKEAMSAVDYFNKNGIFFDYVVIINEGLALGGGMYPLASNSFMGYLMPILKEEFVFITSLDYYRRTNERGVAYKMLDLPYKVEELFCNDQEYIDPEIFSDYKFIKQLYKMQKYSQIDSFASGLVECIAINDSMWLYEKTLDALFIHSDIACFKFHPHLSPRRNKRIFNIKDKTPKEILDIALEHEYKTIGLMPWINGSHDELLSAFDCWSGDYAISIKLFYLNSKDREYIVGGG